MITCLQLAERLDVAAAQVRTGLDVPTEATMVIAAAQAKESLGTYRYGWPELAASTQADRVAKGYPADEPLLRTGALADSISHRARLTGLGAEGLVYSTDIVALYQELGTSRIPPRSFLFASMVWSIPEMRRLFVAFAVKLLTGARA